MNLIHTADKKRNLKYELAPAMLDFMEAVKMHESNGDYSKRQTVDVSEEGEEPEYEDVGVGAGAYQFEMAGTREGEWGAATAVQRAYTVAKKWNMDDDLKWLEKLNDRKKEGEDIDFSKLPEWQQDFLFIADKIEAEDIKLDDILTAYNLGSAYFRNTMYAKLWGEGHKRADSWRAQLDTLHGYKALRHAVHEL
jgi:hypothetical protein